MFDFNALLSAFFLVFISELGDKTQIAVFAFSASTKKPVQIFFASACALVLSTIIASFLGRITAHFLPGFTGYIASALFIIFGIVILLSKETPLIQDCFVTLLSMEQAVKKNLEHIAPPAARKIEIEEETHRVLLRYLIDEKKFFQDDINEEPELQELFTTLKNLQFPDSGMDKRELLSRLIALEEIGIRFYRYLLTHVKKKDHYEPALEIELSEIVREEEGHRTLFKQMLEDEL